MSLAEKFNEYCEQQKKMFTDGDPIEQIIKKITIVYLTKVPYEG